jgi:hypothetical protein
MLKATFATHRESPLAMKPSLLRLFGFVVLAAIVLATGFGALG